MRVEELTNLDCELESLEAEIAEDELEVQDIPRIQTSGGISGASSHGPLSEAGAVFLHALLGGPPGREVK